MSMGEDGITVKEGLGAGIPVCCARVASGHAAAALPSVAMNSRRRIWIAMCPSYGGQDHATEEDDITL